MIVVFDSRRKKRSRRYGQNQRAGRAIRRRNWGQQATVLVSLLALGGADQVPGMTHQIANAARMTGSNAAHGVPSGDNVAPPAEQATPAAPATPVGTPDVRPSSNAAAATPKYGIPATVLDSYVRAAGAVQITNPGCNLSWPLLAGIGKVESGHANNGNVAADGRMTRPLYGPTLNGTNNTAAVPGSGGEWSRAEGPMQFLPSSWARWGSDGNGDGGKDTQNVYDASLAAGHYLCSGGRDLRTPAGLRSAILSYNNSDDYVKLVLSWMKAYSDGGGAIPDESRMSALEQIVWAPSDREKTSEAEPAQPAPIPPPRERPPQPEPPRRKHDPDRGAPVPAPKPPSAPPVLSLVAPARKLVTDPVKDTVGAVAQPVGKVLDPPHVQDVLGLPK